MPSEHAGATSIATTSGPSAGYGAGVNPMRATSGVAEGDAARVSEVQRGSTLDAPAAAEERMPDARYAGAAPTSGVRTCVDTPGAGRMPGDAAI